MKTSQVTLAVVERFDLSKTLAVVKHSLIKCNECQLLSYTTTIVAMHDMRSVK